MAVSTSRRAAASTGAAARIHSDNWRNHVKDAHRRPLQLWLWSVAAMTFAVLVVGGITRLTHSGLSIVDWKPLLGVIPPLNDTQWQEVFDQYRQFPEYQLTREGMSLGEFRFIYFWEYTHRLLARTIGLVFLLPFLFFWLRGYFTRPLLRRSLLLFALGAMQGVMGWLMVQSGLVDRPSVSHYRLAAHLSLAFLIFAWAVWLAREVATPKPVVLERGDRRLLLRLLSAIGVLLSVQIVWGAFVAGLRAGKVYPTFPLMGGRLVPVDLLALQPPLENFIANAVAVQWTHRVLGTLLAAVVIAAFFVVRRRLAEPVSRRYNAALGTLIVAQYALGITTLLFLVPVALGALHQAFAMIVFGVWLCWLHHVARAEDRERISA